MLKVAGWFARSGSQPARLAAVALLLAWLAAGLAGCDASSSAPSGASTPTGPVVAGKAGSGAAVGYLMTCETTIGAYPPSCFLRPLNADGSARWTRHFILPIGPNLADDQTIYMTEVTNQLTNAGSVVAFNASDGSQRWISSEQDAIFPQVATSDALYGSRVSTGSNGSTGQLAIAALGAVDGKPLWSTPVGQGSLQQAIVDGGRLYARTGLGGSDGPPDDHLVALDAASGKVIWKTAIAGAAGPIAVYGATLYVCVAPVPAGSNVSDPTAQSSIVAYNAISGAVRWKHAIPLRSLPRLLAATGDAVYAAVGQTAQGGVAALGASTGQLLWSTPLGKSLDTFTGLVALDGTVYTATASQDPVSVGHLYALNPSTGAVSSDQTMKDGGVRGLQQFGGMLYLWTFGAGQQSGHVATVRPSDGSQPWSVAVDNSKFVWFQADV